MLIEFSLKSPPKQQILCLELLLDLFSNVSPQIFTKKGFLEIIKNSLVELLLRNCISSEENVINASFEIFTSLVMSLREHLKKEIFIFINQIFFKLLDSGNSSYSHRFLTLKVFSQIFTTPRHLLEFFVNYDCDVAFENLFEKISEILSRISQGKYSKSAFSVGIQPAQDLVLRKIALETLLGYLMLIDQIIEENEEIKAVETEGEITKDENLKEVVEEDTNFEILEKFFLYK